MKNHLSTLTLAVFYTFIFSGSSYSQDNNNLNLGNPSNATSEVSNTDNYLIIKPQYVVSYSNTKHIPNWVSWHEGVSDLGSFKRQNKFRPDPTLPSDFYAVKPSDYSNSGFDKGHMCPSADRTSNAENNSATFFMTNMIPQSPHNNQITWVHLEAYSRKLVKQGKELYIVSGPLGQGGEGKNGSASVIKNDVVVPAQTWKIVVVLNEGDNDISRIDTLTRVIAVLIPNNQSCSEKEWSQYRVPVKQLESLTGFNFLSNLPVSIQKVIEAKVDTTTVY